MTDVLPPLGKSIPPAASPSVKSRIADKLSGRWRMVPVLATLGLIFIIFGSQSAAFLSARNLSNLSLQIVVTAFLALALVLVLIVGEIDLSLAALGAVATAVMAKLFVQAGLPGYFAVALGLSVGVAFGIAQGFVVTRFRAPAFIVTLGTSLILQGVLLQLLPRTGVVPLAGTFVENIAGTYMVPWSGYALVLIASVVVLALTFQTYRHHRREGKAASVFKAVGVPTLLCLVLGSALIAVFNAHRGVPVAVVLLLAFLSVMAYVTTQTRFGTYLYAIGGNAEAARRAGIHVRRIRVATFALAGFFAAVAGLVAASRSLGISSQSGGGTLLLEAVAAAVIGGASLFGGRGSVWAALLGALVIGSISNGLDLLGADGQIKLMVQGAILVVAVSVDGVLTAGRRAG